MIADIGLRWVLSALFVAAGVYCACRCVRPSGATAAVGFALHTLMCVAMIAMLWPWGMRWPVLPQVVLFAAGALWFAGRVALARGTHRVEHVLHAGMMAVMAWMLAIMPVAMSSMGASTMVEMHPGHLMAMTVSAPLPAHVVIVGVVAALALLLAGATRLAVALDTARIAARFTRSRAAAPLTESAMHLGMAVMVCAVVL